jgi:carboxyl-terminal processing protease
MQLKTDSYARIAVVRVMPGRPAEQAGVRAGDILIAIDGQAAAGMKLEDVVARVRGAVGTSVVVEVQRPGTADPLRFVLVRASLRAQPPAPAP